MVEILVRSDQRTGATSIGGSRRARNWTLAVACMGVGLVVASMTALNTALRDLAVATSATQSQRLQLWRASPRPFAARQPTRLPRRWRWPASWVHTAASWPRSAKRRSSRRCTLRCRCWP